MSIVDWEAEWNGHFHLLSSRSGEWTPHKITGILTCKFRKNIPTDLAAIKVVVVCSVWPNWPNVGAALPATNLTNLHQI